MYWITEAYGVNDDLLVRTNWVMFGNKLQNREMLMEHIIDHVAGNQSWSPNSLRGKSEQECMRLLGIVRVTAEARGPGRERIKQSKVVIAEIEPEEVIDHGLIMIRDGKRVSLSALRKHLLTLDDFLLTFVPDPETGQYSNLSDPEVIERIGLDILPGSPVREAGIADGTPVEDCYRRLFENTMVEFVRLIREINKVTGVRVLLDPEEPFDGGQFKQITDED